MTEVAQVVEGSVVSRVDVLDDAELVQPLQHTVDRRFGDARCAPLGLGDDVLGGEVAIAVEQRLDDRPRADRHPTPRRRGTAS